MKFIFFILFSASFFSYSEMKAQIPQGASFWLRADSGVVKSVNQIVTEWKDQSGTSKSAFQTFPVAQPTLIPNSINNFPAIHFDGRYDYFDCPPIFPIFKDYTVTIVTRINDFSKLNNLVSGNSHAIYLGGTTFPYVLNDTAQPWQQVVSHIPLSVTQPTLITVTYRQNTQRATIYINGTLADSGYVGTNKDSSLYLGAFQEGQSVLSGDLAEIILYSRTLSESDRKQLEDYLFTKYAIPPTPAPDSIYTAVPKHLQFYPRDNDDSATVAISGNFPDPGYDSIYLKSFKNGIFTGRVSQPLIYQEGKAPFSFTPRIHAELSEYSFLLGIKSASIDKQIGFRDSIVCGDVILISGQSNSINNNLEYTNEFFRTFGSNQASSLADTAWEVSSTAVTFGPGPISGSWGIRLQEDMMNTYQVPTCVINGGVGGTAIALHLPDPLNRMNIGTFYGNMLYRATISGLAAKAKMILWYQGESDVISGYASSFKQLYNAWKQDYPNVQKIYVMQVRPGCTLGFGADVRDLLRTLQDSFPNVESVSTMGLPGHDGCHFDSTGYKQLGDQLFRLLARDFYGSSDVAQISSPNIIQAYYTNSAHSQIGLTFTPSETRFVIPSDTTVGGIPASIKDYFYLNDSGEVVKSISTVRNRIFIELIQSSSARLINYLPDKYYNHTSAIYEGPWLENTRGVGAFSFYHVPIVDSAQAGVSVNNDVSPLSLQAYPNPSDGKFKVRYELTQTQDVTITISDLLGRIVATFAKGRLSMGAHEDILDCRTLLLSNGRYICTLRARNIIVTSPLLIER